MTETPPQAPTEASLNALIELVIEAEKRLVAGPWDRWDETVLVAWRDAAKARLRECLNSMPGAHYADLLRRWLAWYDLLEVPPDALADPALVLDTRVQVEP